jgi:hypothetical protein
MVSHNRDPNPQFVHVQKEFYKKLRTKATAIETAGKK